ncbi:MAG: transcriptional regulator [Thermoflexaceae bacterium]|nr:transcriptional regulator [Thermoflexaceae bacterium]
MTAMFPLTNARLQVLVAIKQAGEADVQHLAAELHLTLSALRPQLLQLQAKGLISYRLEGTGPGRRRHVYRLTQEGEAMFPDNSRVQLSELVPLVENAVPGLMESWFKDRLERLWAEDARRVRDDSTEAKVEAGVTGALSRGYIGTTDRDGDDIVLRVAHCPLLALSSAWPRACALELESMRKNLKSEHVERTAWKLDGDPVCEFRVPAAVRSARAASRNGYHLVGARG